MWVFNIRTGQLQHDLVPVGSGYSGAGHTAAEGRNNPAMTHVEGKGPIPLGDYRIEAPRDSKTLGPVVMDLTPMPGTETFGRSLFRIHGNDKDNDASHGCVILDHVYRVMIANERRTDTILRVIAN